MNKRFENKMVMLRALLTLLKANQSLWIDSPPLVNAVNQIENLIAVIEATLLITGKKYSGMVTEKTKLQKLLIIKTFELTSMLLAMASSTENDVLMEKVNFPISELQRQRDGELASTCKGIALLTHENMPALVGYPISEPELVSYQQQITQYEVGLPNHRVSVSERKAANAKLKDLIKLTDDVLNKQVDRLMIRFVTLHPDFYAAYHNTRKVVDYGTRYEKNDEDETDSDKPAE